MFEVKNEIKNQETKSFEEELNSSYLKTPYVNVVESNDDFTLYAVMPGVSKENVKINFENKHLTIMGKASEAPKGKFTINEFVIGNYFRKFRLSENIDAEKIEAEMNNGILTVLLPKYESVKPRTISIK